MVRRRAATVWLWLYEEGNKGVERPHLDQEMGYEVIAGHKGLFTS